MKISYWSGKAVGQWSGKIMFGALFAGALWISTAKAVTADNVAPLGSQNPPPPRSAYSPGVQDVLKMADAKVDPEVLKAYIKNSPHASSLSADEIIDLKKKGVSDAIVTEMIQHGAEVRAQAAAAAPVPPPASVSPQYNANVAAPAPAVAAPGYDYGYADYGYPYDYSSYPYYSLGYPYGYNYWWWSSYGYPWYGYSPFFYADVFGHRHFRGFDRDRFGHYGHYGPWRGFDGHRGYGTPGRGQPWRPVGGFAGRSSYRPSFGPARSFGSRPNGGFVSRSPSFAVRSGGLRGGGGFHGGGGFGGHSMGGGHGGGHR
ncbi:MAG TPA: hypothetical protein VHI52_09435 [Verrucomicrobiae bacterium]|nr:hypothetical protein [Verrucomicrobiae bacterium]